MSGYYYLGSPYSLYRDGLAAADTAARVAAAQLMAARIPVYTPIGHCHAISLVSDLDPLDADMWLSLNRDLMDAAKGLIVLKLDGWLRSKGLAHEIDVFRAAKKPIIFMEPGSLPEGLQ